MISGPTVSQPLGGAGLAARTGRPAPAPGQGVRPVVEARGEPQGGARFTGGGRGFIVDGGTLVAAQEEGNRPRKTAEEPAEEKKASPSELSEDERKEVRDLQKRDQEVRAHEAAHRRAGGRYASAAEFEFERGPDGKSYAVGGHVSISTSPVAGDAEATVDKMDMVRRAALAPADPSGADRSAAADATAKRNAARAEIAAAQAEDSKARFDDNVDVSGPGRPDEDTAADAVAPVADSETTEVSGRSEESGEAETAANDAASVAQGPTAADGFLGALSQGLGRVAGAALGGIDRLETGAGGAGDTARPAPRTGVDIRV